MLILGLIYSSKATVKDKFFQCNYPLGIKALDYIQKTLSFIIIYCQINFHDE